MSGGALNESAADLGGAELAGIASGALAETLGVKDKPDFLSVIKHMAAIPQYPIGFPYIKKAIEEALGKEKGLFLAGNAFYGVGVNDCTKRAAETGAQVIQYAIDKKAGA
jgi:oxygen-dependent protoporphyrinogen oxidase